MASIQELTLPISGKTATVRRPTGRDIVGAEQLTGKDGGERAYNLALLSRVTLIGGVTVPYEDLLDLDAEDIGALMQVDLGFTESQPKPS
nr:phage tail assembly protein [uncultured Holophaga sp.]